MKAAPLPGWGSWEINPDLQTELHYIVITERSSKRIVALVRTEDPVYETTEEWIRAKLICMVPELVVAARNALPQSKGNCPAYKQMQAVLTKAGVL